MCPITMKRFTSYKITVTPVSPIHIGSGESIDPTEYTIDERNNYYRFHLSDFIASLTPAQRDELMKLNDREDLLAVRRFIRINFNPDIAWSRVPVDKSITAVFEDKFKRGESFLEIATVIRDQQSGQPYIPASTIKGAVRTAILDRLAGLNHIKPRFSDDRRRKHEGQLLNALSQRGSFDVTADPFKDVKISDCFFDPGENNVILKIVKNIGSKKGPGIETVNEVVPLRTSSNKAPTAQGTMSISEHFSVAGTDFNLDDIKSMCKDYYHGTFKRDMTMFYKQHNIDIIWFEKWFEKQIAGCADNQFPLRIGKFQGKHFMTVSTAPKRFPVTRNLCDGKFPLGWVLVSFERT